MKNKDLGTVEFLIFLIKPFFSSIFGYLLSFAPIFGNCLFLVLGKNLCFTVQHSCCNHHLRLCSSSKNTCKITEGSNVYLLGTYGCLTFFKNKHKKLM